MPPARYSISGYRNRVRTSRYRTLLVEGPTDKVVFRALIDECSGGSTNPADSITIDTTEMIRGDGNREKVESVCRGWIEKTPATSGKLTGFVDREFQGFDPAAGMDKWGSHRVEGVLHTARGHSVENYLFDFDTYREIAAHIALVDDFGKAVSNFERVFDSALRLACAVGLAGIEIKNWRLTAKSITWKCLLVEGRRMMIDEDVWLKDLKKRKLDEYRIQHIRSTVREWISRLGSADQDVVRWMCHGHVGVELLWASYARCVFDATNDKTIAESVYHAGEKVRQNVAARIWARRAIAGGCVKPDELLARLGCGSTKATAGGVPTSSSVKLLG